MGAFIIVVLIYMLQSNCSRVSHPPVGGVTHPDNFKYTRVKHCSIYCAGGLCFANHRVQPQKKEAAYTTSLIMQIKKQKLFFRHQYRINYMYYSVASAKVGSGNIGAINFYFTIFNGYQQLATL